MPLIICRPVKVLQYGCGPDGHQMKLVIMAAQQSARRVAPRQGQQFGKVRAANQDRIAADTPVGGCDELTLPGFIGSEQPVYDLRANHRLIRQNHKDGIGLLRQMAQANLQRGEHFTFRIGRIVDDVHLAVCCDRIHFFRLVPGNDETCIHLTMLQLVEGVSENGVLAPREQKFRDAHSPALSGGEDDSRYVLSHEQQTATSRQRWYMSSSGSGSWARVEALPVGLRPSGLAMT